MITYAKNELVSVTKLSKQFGEYITKVKDGEVNKIGVLKNNKLGVVILPVEEYERIATNSAEFEDYCLVKMAEERLKTPKSEYIDGNQVLAKLGLSLNV